MFFSSSDEVHSKRVDIDRVGVEILLEYVYELRKDDQFA
jgi:hypothetical protein